jgi:hypothetical protein
VLRGRGLIENKKIKKGKRERSPQQFICSAREEGIIVSQQKEAAAAL